MSAPNQQRILVIKHSALGDFILAMGAFKAIRRHHQDAHITLLTTKPYEALGRACGYFDAVEVDTKPGALQWGKWLALRRFLVRGGFARIYDLQHSDRTHAYFRFFGRRPPEWSGIVKGCSHPHDNPQRNAKHTLERQAEQLALAGITEVPAPELSWLEGDVSAFGLTGRYALLVPGGAAHRPEKRWPAQRYVTAASWLAERGVTPVALGTAIEAAETATIVRGETRTLDLCGRTSLGQIATLARGAVLAIGNDTGPMHIVAAVDCPSVVLFSAASAPSQTQPRGRAVATLQRPDLAMLDAETVLSTVRTITDLR